MEYVPAKSIVHPVKYKGEWFGHEYNMNIYRGCSHGCIYCDSRSDCYHIDDFSDVRAKENALEIIERDLRGRKKKGVVGTGAMSDPYNPMEEKAKLTRGAMILLNRHKFGASITTKSKLVTRDIDIFKKIAKHSPMTVSITITTFDDVLCKKLEPNVSLSSERFEALRELSENGIYAGILMMPILPFINDTEENIISIVRKAHECGAKFIFPFFGMTTRDGQRETYLKEIEKIDPNAKRRHVSMYSNSYECPSPEHSLLRKAFRDECDALGIVYEMKRIIESYVKQKGQRTLRDFF